MNIALGAVLIFILLTPPIAFYVSYSFGRFAKAGPKFTLLDGLLASAIFSLLIHAAGLTLIGFFSTAPVRLDLLLKLVGGDVKEISSADNRALSHSLKQFALYNVVIFILALSMGRACRRLVLRRDKHHNNELLRLNNKWWYLFNGYYLPEMGFENRSFDLLFVDAVVDTKDETIIYSGYLVDFVCNGEELDRIYLSDTLRRSFSRKRPETQSPVFVHEPGDAFSIPGAFFSLAYKDIKNLNLRFLSFENSIEEIEALAESGNDDSDGR